MKKVLSLVLSLVLVLGMMPVFAVEDMGSAGENLKHYEFITGGTGGDLMEDKEFTREQLAKILAELNGKAEEAAAFEGTVNFKDADEIGAWALPYVAYAVEQDWLVGNDKNEFMPKGIVSGKELLTAMLRVLGYETEWATVVEEAAEVGFTASEGELTRGQAFETIWTVVSEIPAKGSDVALGVELGKLEADKPAELAIKGVAATNLKEVMVEFNQAIDKETVKDANFVIKKGTTSVKATAVLTDDMMVVLTSEDKLTNQGAYTVTVKGVKSVDGAELAEVTQDFTVFDRELPEAKELAVTGPRNLDITFSEPLVADKGTVEIKEGSTVIGNGVVVSGKIASVTAYTNFSEGKTYSVKVTDFEDYAGYKNVIATLEFTYNKDVNPPVAKIVKAEQEYVIVEFDKPVKGLEAKNFYHTFTAWNALELYTATDYKTTVEPTDSVKTVVVRFYDSSLTGAAADKNRPLPEGTVNVGISGADIKDNWSNKLGDVMLPVEISSDKTPLAVNEIEVKGEDKIVVKFNKAVKEFATKNIEVLDKDGKAISGLYVASIESSNGDKDFTVTFNKKQPGKTLTVNIKNVVESSLTGTKITLETFAVEITDKTAPTVAKVYYNLEREADFDSAKPKYKTKNLFVQFSEAVDGETALTAANYSIVYENEAKDVVVLTGTPSFDGGNTRVKITLTDAQAYKFETDENVSNVISTKTLQVINVKDIAGNTIAPKQNEITGTVSDHVVDVKSVKATKKNTVVLTFNDMLQNVKPTNFKFTTTTGAAIDADAFTLTQVYDGNNTVVTLEHNKNLLDTDADNGSVKVIYSGIKSSYGSAVEKMTFKGGAEEPKEMTITAGIDDKIAPEIMKYATGDNKDKYMVERTAADTIKITFTENIKPPTVSSLTFNVENATVTAANAVDNVVTLTITPGTGMAEAPKVTQNVKVLDASDNELLVTDVLDSIKLDY